MVRVGSWAARRIGAVVLAAAVASDALRLWAAAFPLPGRRSLFG
jgi:hypothetical protein